MSGVLVAVGAIALLIALLGALGFIMMKMKGGRIAKTPFVKTGDLAAKGDSVCGEKNSISTEGKLIKPAEMLTSPVDGKECLMYRLTVTAKWKAGDNEVSVEMMKEEKSVDFQIDDGSGPVKIVPGTTGDFEPLHKFNQTKGKGLKAAFTGGGIKFGETNFEVHPGGRYKGKLVPDNAKIQVQETALLPSEMFYANGKWEEGAIRKHSWTSLILSPKSRDETLAATLKTQTNAKYAAIGGGVLGPILLGIGLAIAPAKTDTPDGDKAKTEQVEAKPEGKAKSAPAGNAGAKKSEPAKTAKEEPKKTESKPAASGGSAPKAGPKAGGGGAPKGRKKKR